MCLSELPAVRRDGRRLKADAPALGELTCRDGGAKLPLLPGSKCVTVVRIQAMGEASRGQRSIVAQVMWLPLSEWLVGVSERHGLERPTGAAVRRPLR
jgi:hypothetical protein